MTFEEILDLLRRLLLKLLGILLGVAGLWILWLLAGLIGKGLAWLLGIAATTGTFIVVVIIILIVVLIWWRDKGIPIVTAGCTLMKYRFRPDACSTTTCAKPCIAITGPYPSWAGSLTLTTQDIGCICGTSPLAAFAPYLQKLWDSALNSKEISEVDREIEKLTGSDINDPRLDKLVEILRKLKANEELTPEERKELERLLLD